MRSYRNIRFAGLIRRGFRSALRCNLLILFSFLAWSGNLKAQALQEASKNLANPGSSSPLKPQVKASSFESYVMCRSSSQARTLRVVQTSRGCITRYQRDGQEKVVATAQSLGVCQDVLTKIQKNLMENNWNCQDISQSAVSSAE